MNRQERRRMATGATAAQPQLPPLHIPDFPMTGPTGERDNLERFHAVLAALLPPGRVTVLELAHDGGCPCESGDRPASACTCDTVDLTLRPVDPRRS